MKGMVGIWIAPALAMLGLALVAFVLVLAGSRLIHSGGSASTQPRATAGAKPPAPRINGVAGELGSFCWGFRGAAISQLGTSLVQLPSPLPSDYVVHHCADAGPPHFAPAVTAPLHLWLPNLQADVTVRVADSNGAGQAASLSPDGTIGLPAGQWRTLTVGISWPGDAPNTEVGDAGYAWTLR